MLSKKTKKKTNVLLAAHQNRIWRIQSKPNRFPHISAVVQFFSEERKIRAAARAREREKNTPNKQTNILYFETLSWESDVEKRRLDQQFQMCKCASPRLSELEAMVAATTIRASRQCYFRFVRLFFVWRSPVSWIIYSMINVRNATVSTLFLSPFFSLVQLSFALPQTLNTSAHLQQISRIFRFCFAQWNKCACNSILIFSLFAISISNHVENEEWILEVRSMVSETI